MISKLLPTERKYALLKRGALSLAFAILILFANEPAIPAVQEAATIEDLNKKIDALEHRFDMLQKASDDALWFHRLGDAAFIDKVFIAGPPRKDMEDSKLMGAKNPLKFWCYVFIPKEFNPDKKYPLIILPHGGVHADFTTYHTHIILEMLAQGYVVAAPEYRGSTGYGESFYNAIDYGGLEVEDCDAAREYMIENYEFVDGGRVAMVGWSHGGLIALMNAFNRPDAYKCVFAGVPVSDLIMRMGYYEDDYRDLFSGKNHLGGTAHENLEEYKRRSPVWYASKLKIPLLIHTNTNDDDVYYVEVEHLIQALKAEGKDFEYEVFKDAPGGHSFDRIDIKPAREARLKIHKFLGKYLKPEKPINSLKDMERAAYVPKSISK